MSTQSPILFSATQEGVGILTLNRPEQHNAFNPDLAEALAELFDDLRGQDGMRVLLIKGAGECFSAGRDGEWLKAVSHHTHGDNTEEAQLLADMLHRLYMLPQATVALVNGDVAGAGMGLIAASDIAISRASARYAFPDVHHGMTPAAISPYVIEAIGPRLARALFITGEWFDANHARSIGFIHSVVDNLDSLAAAEERLVGQILKGAPGASAAAKVLVRDVMWREIDAGLRKTTALRSADRRGSDEGQEGIKAFLEKRGPSWTR